MAPPISLARMLEDGPSEDDWFGQLPRTRGADDVYQSPQPPLRDLPFKGTAYLPEEFLYQAHEAPRAHEGDERGRLPTRAEKAEQFWRGEIERKANQPWWSEGRNPYRRPDPNSTAADIFHALTLGLAALPPPAINGAVRGGIPAPMLLPGLGRHLYDQPGHHTGGPARLGTSAVGAYTDRPRPYEGSLPEPEPRAPRGHLDETPEAGIVFPAGKRYEPSILRQLAPSFVGNHVDLDSITNDPLYHLRHIADPLLATWGLMGAGQAASALNTLGRSWNRFGQGLGETVETADVLRKMSGRP